jgi:uncharacterized membrane protein YkoI
MRMRTFLVGAVLTCATVATAAGSPSAAQSMEPNWAVPRRSGSAEQVQANLISVRDAFEIIRRQRGGRPLGHEVERSGGRTIYVISWLDPDNTAVTIRVDAATGAIL